MEAISIRENFHMHLYMRRSALILTLLATLGIAYLTSLSGTLFAQATCNLHASGAAAPTNYGLAWNPFTSAKELLLESYCNTDGSVRYTVGSNDSNQYIYKNGYWYAGQWNPFTLQGPAITGATDWRLGQATYTHASAPSTDHFWVGYVCHWQSSAASWKCGCRDSVCSANYWQLQGVVRGSGGAGGSGNFAPLEAPPSMTRNPATFTNVCPGEAGWPSQSQAAGRDIRIILPTDRVCTNPGTINGYDTNPVHNVWVVGGEIDITAGDGGGITLRWWDGTAFFEGLDIDVNNADADGIRSYFAKGPDARIVIQNSRIRGMGYDDIHGDMYHAQGGLPVVKELVMQNVRGELINQGIFVPYRTDGHGVRRMVLDHVELVLDPRFKYCCNAGGTYKISTMIYAGPSGSNDTINLFPPDGQSYNDVYLNWWDPHYPSTYDQNRTFPAAVSFDENNRAVFSSSDITNGKIQGTYYRGNPPGGTFVPLDKIGLNYDRSFFAN